MSLFDPRPYRPAWAASPRVLVTAASRTGSTEELAFGLAARLRAHGMVTEVVRPAEVQHVTAYDAVLLGSAIYHTRWLPEAVDLAARCSAEWAPRPVWLFSSGPVGRPEGWVRRVVRGPDPLQLAALFELTSAREHRSFAGRVLAARLPLHQRCLARLIPGLVGDFRNWPALRSWCDHVAADLGVGNALRT